MDLAIKLSKLNAENFAVLIYIIRRVSFASPICNIAILEEQVKIRTRKLKLGFFEPSY